MTDGRPLWKRLLGIDAPPRQTTWVYCPGCGADLCTEPGTTYSDTDLVRYACGRCEHRSAWLFDAPVPILIQDDLATSYANRIFAKHDLSPADQEMIHKLLHPDERDAP